jgi:hypothetical protein
MKNRFDLETDIMQAWNTTEDIDLIYHATDNLKLNAEDCDTLQNQLLGLKYITELRFQKLWDTFESAINNGVFDDRVE